MSREEECRITQWDRRLPVYAVLDCSSSMEGEPIEACRQGLRALLSELRQDYQASSVAWVSVILYHSTAFQAVPLVPLPAFREPHFSAGGTSRLGAALRLLCSCIDRERAAGEQTDYKPLVFLFSDGASTDDWQDAFEKVQSKAVFIACGAGARVNTTFLRGITEKVLTLNTLSIGELSEYFIMQKT